MVDRGTHDGGGDWAVTIVLLGIIAAVIILAVF